MEWASGATGAEVDGMASRTTSPWVGEFLINNGAGYTSDIIALVAQSSAPSDPYGAGLASRG